MWFSPLIVVRGPALPVRAHCERVTTPRDRVGGCSGRRRGRASGGGRASALDGRRAAATVAGRANERAKAVGVASVRMKRVCSATMASHAEVGCECSESTGQASLRRAAIASWRPPQTFVACAGPDRKTPPPRSCGHHEISDSRPSRALGGDDRRRRGAPRRQHVGPPRCPIGALRGRRRHGCVAVANMGFP